MTLNSSIDNVKAFVFSIYILLPFFSESLSNNFHVHSYIIYFLILTFLILTFIPSKPLVNKSVLIYLLFFGIVNLIVFCYADSIQIKYVLSVLLAIVVSTLFIFQKEYNFVNTSPNFVFYISIVFIPILTGGLNNGIELYLAGTRMGFDVNPLSLAVLSGFAIVSFSYKKKITLDFIFLLIPIFGFIVSASKGPLIALLLLWLCTSSKRISFINKVVISLVVAFVGAFFVTLGRGGVATDNSVSIREYLYSTSFDLISKNIFIPQDLSSLEAITGIGYPHNLFLDVWMNSGLVSMLFLLSTIIILLYISAIGKKGKFLNSSALYLFFVMMFSFSYFDMVKLLIPLSFISISYYCHEVACCRNMEDK
ncbi:hypothetical protein [Vibrio proteolyticus]